MVYFDGLSYIGLEDIPEGQQYRWFRDESDEFCNIQDGLNDGYKFVPYSRHEKKLKLRVESFPIGETINYRGLVLMERPEQPILNGVDHPDYDKWVSGVMAQAWINSLDKAGTKSIPDLKAIKDTYDEFYLSTKEVTDKDLSKWDFLIPDHLLDDELQRRKDLPQSRIQERDIPGEITVSGSSCWKPLILPLDHEGK